MLRPAGRLRRRRPAPDAQSITLYNGQHVQTTQTLVAAFEKQTGITVNVRSDDEDVLANQIATEGAHSPADVFFTENSPPLESLQAKGLLAKVDAATLATPRPGTARRRATGSAISARVSVLVYNPALIPASQLPTTVSQLADPQYRGKLALAPQETDFQPIVTSYLRAYGRPRRCSWLKGDQGQRQRRTSTRTTRRSPPRSTGAPSRSA